MRFLIVMLASLLLCPMAPAVAQVDVPGYPRMVAVARSPVYFDPGSASNYFFYDGMYWVYEADVWYTGSWFNGPWTVVAPLAVPVYLLRVPVRFYRNRPAYFRGWNPDEPPRWGDHWGTQWERQRRGWDRWEPTSVPRPAPLPVYQRQYEGNRYPAAELQATLQDRNYPYKSQHDMR